MTDYRQASIDECGSLSRYAWMRVSSRNAKERTLCAAVRAKWEKLLVLDEEATKNFYEEHADEFFGALRARGLADDSDEYMAAGDTYEPPSVRPCYCMHNEMCMQAAMLECLLRLGNAANGYELPPNSALNFACREADNHRCDGPYADDDYRKWDKVRGLAAEIDKIARSDEGE